MKPKSILWVSWYLRKDGSKIHVFILLTVNNKRINTLGNVVIKQLIESRISPQHGARIVWLAEKYAIYISPMNIAHTIQIVVLP